MAVPLSTIHTHPEGDISMDVCCIRFGAHPLELPGGSLNFPFTHSLVGVITRAEIGVSSEKSLPWRSKCECQYDEMILFLQDLETNEHYDSWQFQPGAAQYKVSKSCQILSGSHNPLSALKWIWKTCCQLKHKIFYWLLVHDRLNTRALLPRKHFFI